MSLDYYPGQAIPGEGRRNATLDWKELSTITGVLLYPGTLNVMLMEPLDLKGVKIHTHEKFWIYPCVVSDRKRILANEPAIDGWLLRIKKENDLPSDFIEVISEKNLRKELNKVKWPAFGVEIGL